MPANTNAINLQSLNPAQMEAVTAPDGPLLVIAGAGSGKTRTIVYRLAWLCEKGVPPSSMLLLTFTRKAAHEMLERATRLLERNLNDVHGGTFHAFAYSVLRRHRPNWAIAPVTVMDGQDSVSALQHCRDKLKIGKNDRSFPRNQSVLSLLSKARNKELPIQELLWRETPHLALHGDAFTSLEQAYAAYRREHNLLDYDDLLFELENLLNADTGMLTQLRDSYTHLMVDEYQDTNRVQARLTHLLAGENGNVMAVGDDAQSIYAFRGANVRNILDFKSFFPTARLIRLEENYRSTQPILDVANGVLSQSRENFAKNLYSNKKDGFMPRLVRPMSDRRQAEIIALRIEKLLEEYNPGEIAVLFRAGYQSYHLEVALAKRNLRFRKYGGLRYAEAAHIKDVLAYARLVVNPLDRPSLLRIADMSRGVGSKTAHKIFELLRVGDTEKINGMCAKYAELSNDLALLESLRKSNLQPAALLDEICSHYQPRLELAHPEDWPRRLQGIEELSHIASAYSDLEQFIADLSLESPEEDQENDGIVLSTIHSAKGLEWDAVLLIDLVEDRFPSRHALARPEDYEEERRLMYVAITRARQILELYVPLTIYSKATGSSERASDSPFVRDLSAWLYEEWQENYNGALQRRDIQATNFRPKPAQTVPSQINANTPVDEEPIFFKNEKLEYGFCHHKIFGRGKIVEHIPPDKCRVNFFGIGLKVIIASYLTMEE